MSSSLIGFGSTGAAVTTLQRELGVTADGIDGAQTTAAVKSFQKAHGLKPDGIVGKETEAALESLKHAPAAGAVEPTLSQGSTGTAVRTVQAKLGVTQDGIDGPETTQAIRNFQQRNGLSVDGIVGKQTWHALEGAAKSGSTSVAPAPTHAAPVAPAAPVTSGGSSSASQRIAAAALDFKGTSTIDLNGAPAGNECAAAVNHVLVLAGLPAVGGGAGGTNLVNTLEAKLPGAGYAKVTQDQAVPGDIVILHDGVSGGIHTGIYLGNGMMISNASGTNSFSWVDTVANQASNCSHNDDGVDPTAPTFYHHP